MKIQYKASLIMASFGIAIVVILSLGYYILSHNLIMSKELNNIKNVSNEVAMHIDSDLRVKIDVAITLASAPIIKNTLIKSNSEFFSYSNKIRSDKIVSLNRKWMETNDSKDLFIQSYMTNNTAKYLKEQQSLLPGVYGEIFLTNRFGVMIATTGKLTTLAHSHKYWWTGCYDNGKGKIFLDDRGYDSSVKGYVLGVVIPIKDKGKLIGILKCNFNIKGLLTDIVRQFSLRNYAEVKIVRSGGLILIGDGVSPLSTRVNNELINIVQQSRVHTQSISAKNNNELVAVSPIQITIGSDKVIFGGKPKSNDHIDGNKGESWSVIISISKDRVFKMANKITYLIIAIGVIFIIVTTCIAMFLSKLVSNPIVKISKTATDIGNGNLDMRSNQNSKDEIGLLANSLNKMAQNLQATITARDNEINNRKIAETKLTVTNIKLENAHKHAVYMLAVASEYKDYYTGGHIRRMSKITTELALELGVEYNVANKMGDDSVLHDLGKIGISDDILLKPGKLDYKEFEAMKQHTLIGAKIIGDDKWFTQACQIALSHHERWDGKGYPEGLKGNTIPFAARIVAVVDVFDALISERSYKKPWTPKKAIDEITKESGTHFDPQIVEAFKSLYTKGSLKKYFTQ